MCAVNAYSALLKAFMIVCIIDYQNKGGNPPAQAVMSEMSLRVSVMCKSSCLYAQSSVTLTASILLDLFLKLCIDKMYVTLYRFTRFITLDLLFFLNRFGFLRAICLSVSIHVPECNSRQYTVISATTVCGISCNSALVQCKRFNPLAVK